jgi:hypothetical protein
VLGGDGACNARALNMLLHTIFLSGNTHKKHNTAVCVPNRPKQCCTMWFRLFEAGFEVRVSRRQADLHPFLTL